LVEWNFSGTILFLRNKIGEYYYDVVTLTQQLQQQLQQHPAAASIFVPIDFFDSFVIFITKGFEVNNN